MAVKLSDLFEIYEGLDPKQELIAKILLNTSDEDNNPADAPFLELAKKVETGEVTPQEAEMELEELLALQEDGGVGTYVKPMDSTGQRELEKQIKKDRPRDSANLLKALQDARPGTAVVGEGEDEKQYYHWEDFVIDVAIQNNIDVLPLSNNNSITLGLGNLEAARASNDEAQVERVMAKLEQVFYDWKSAMEDHYDLEGDTEVAVDPNNPPHIQIDALKEEKNLREVSLLKYFSK